MSQFQEITNLKTKLEKCARKHAAAEERATEADGRIAILETALSESVKIQSHYASLLNAYDGGKRLQFASAEEWIKRLGFPE